MTCYVLPCGCAVKGNKLGSSFFRFFVIGWYDGITEALCGCKGCGVQYFAICVRVQADLSRTYKLCWIHGVTSFMEWPETATQNVISNLESPASPPDGDFNYQSFRGQWKVCAVVICRLSLSEQWLAVRSPSSDEDTCLQDDGLEDLFR